MKGALATGKSYQQFVNTAGNEFILLLVGFGRACAPVRCAHPCAARTRLFWAHCHAKRGAARPAVLRSFAVFSLYSKNKNNLPNSSRPCEGLLHIFQIYHWGQWVYSARPSIQSSELGPPSTARECCHFRMSGGEGTQYFRRWGIHSGTLRIL